MSTEQEDSHDLAHRPGFLLRRAHQVAVAIFAEEVGELSLTSPQHNVLSAVLANPGTHQAEVSKIVGYDRATVGALIASLEARDLIVRKGTETDKRMRTLTLTPAGKKLLAVSAKAMTRINERIMAPLAPHERPIFIALLAKIAMSRTPADS